MIESIEQHFERCMALWVDWMHRNNHRLGHHSRDSVCGDAMTNYMTAADDSDLVYEASDRKLAQAVQACVDSLLGYEQNAVRIHYGLALVWMFPVHRQDQSLKTGMLRLRQLVAQRC